MYNRITQHVPKFIVIGFIVLALTVPAFVFAEASEIEKGGSAIGEMLLRLSATIFGLAGALFDYAITELIIKTGELLGTGTNLGNTVNDIWTIVRDLCNLVFIFFFFYAGIKTIITRDTSFAKSTIASLIIGALLINFSLFFTKVIIDVTNVAAVETYNILSPNGNVRPGQTFANALKFGDLYGTTVPDGTGDTQTIVTANKTFTWYIIASIFLLVTSFVFFISAIMIVVRFVVLVLGMMLSPFIFIMSLLPKSAGALAKRGKDFQEQFLNSALFPVVFLFLVLISIRVLENLDTGKAGAIALIGTTDSGQFTYVLRFVIATGFMLAALKASKMVSEKASGVASTWTKRGIGAAAFGGAALAGRQVIGRTAHGISENKEVMADLQRRAAEGSTSARLQLKTIAGAQKASFDARQSDTFKKAAGTGVGKSLGLTDLGTGISKEAEKHKQDQGFVGRKTAATLEVKAIEEEKAKILPKFDDKDPLVARRIADEKKFADDLNRAGSERKAAKKAYDKIIEKPDSDPETQKKLLADAQNVVDKAEGKYSEAEKSKVSAADKTERERNRSQVGTTFRQADFDAANVRKNDAEKEVASAQMKLGQATNPASRQVIQGEIEKAQKKVTTEEAILKHQGKTVPQAAVQSAEAAEINAKRVIQAKFDAIRQNRSQAGAGQLTPEEEVRLAEENKQLNKELEAAQKAHADAKKSASETYGGRIGYAQRQGHFASALRNRLRPTTQASIEDRAKQYTKKPKEETKK